VERAVLLCDGETLSVDESWLNQTAHGESSQVSIALGGLRRPEANQERELIEAALAECAGRISGPSGAAAKLGIPRQTLESKMARLGINKTRHQNS
jgi:formate hydrogenlyase transcriptional activator